MILAVITETALDLMSVLVKQDGLDQTVPLVRFKINFHVHFKLVLLNVLI